VTEQQARAMIAADLTAGGHDPADFDVDRILSAAFAWDSRRGWMPCADGDGFWAIAAGARLTP